MIRHLSFRILFIVSASLSTGYASSEHFVAHAQDDVLDFLPTIITGANNRVPSPPAGPTGVAPILERYWCNPANHPNPRPKVAAGFTHSAGWSLYDPDTRIDKLIWQIWVNGEFYQSWNNNENSIIYTTEETDRGLLWFTLKVRDETGNSFESKICEFDIISPGPRIDKIDDVFIDDQGGMVAIEVAAVTGTYIEDGAVFSIDQGHYDLLTINPASGVITFQADVDVDTHYEVTIDVTNPDNRSANSKFVVWIRDSE